MEQLTVKVAGVGVGNTVKLVVERLDHYGEVTQHQEVWVRPGSNLLAIDHIPFAFVHTGRPGRAH